MNKVVYTNHTSDTVYIGGIMVHPGFSRLVDPLLLPPLGIKTEADVSAGEDPDDQIGQLLALSVELIKADILHFADIEQLKMIAEAEINGKDRIGVKDAVAARILQLSQPD